MGAGRSLRLPWLHPLCAVGEGVAGEGFRVHLDAVAGGVRRHVAAAADDDRGMEVFVQVVDELDDAVLEGGGDAQLVEDGDVLDVLAQTDATGVRADRDAKLCSH